MKKNTGLLLCVIAMALLLLLAACKAKVADTVNEDVNNNIDTQQPIKIKTEANAEANADADAESEISAIPVEEVFEINGYTYDGFTQIDLFGEYLREDHLYEITCLGRIIDQLYFVIEDLDLTDEQGRVEYEIFKVSYDYKKVSSVGVIKCDYIPRPDNNIYLFVSDTGYDEDAIIIYSEDSVYFYDLKGKLSRNYVVFGDGDAPWNKSLSPVGDLKEWYTFIGMSIIVYQDDEGVKFYNGLEDSIELLDIVPDGTEAWDAKLQDYVDQLFGKNVLQIASNRYVGDTLKEEIKDREEFIKVLYEDKKAMLLLVEEPLGKMCFLKSIQSPSPIAARILKFKISTFTQRTEANMVIGAMTKLPEPHWSDDLMVRMLDIYDPNFESRIREKIPSATMIEDDNDIVFTLPVGNRDSFKIGKYFFEEFGYVLEEDINIEYSGRNLNYQTTRWNRDRSERLLNAKEIEDDYFAVELDFKNVLIDQKRIETTITDNINYYRASDIKPDIDFEWLDKQRVFVTVTNMEDNQEYVISLNGYVTQDGTCHYTWSSFADEMDSLYGILEGFYDFTKTPSDMANYIEYDSDSQKETELGTIHHYDFYVGPSAGNLVSVALPYEFGYYTYIYDMEKDRMYDQNQFCGNYNDYFEYKNQLYFARNKEIFRIEDNGVMTSVYKTKNDEVIYTVRKHPTQELFCVMSDKEYNNIALTVLDNTFQPINQAPIDYYLLGFYGALIEPYWLDNDSMVITGGAENGSESNKFYTKVYNLNTGKTEGVIEDEKILTVSADGKFILTQDASNGRKLKVYNKALELQNKMEINTTSDNPSYQYMDYWYGHILYLKYNDRDEVYKWNLDTNELTICKLPYTNFFIDQVLGEDDFRLFINTKILERSNPYWP